VRELLRKGAEVDLVNEDGDNPLMAAALNPKILNPKTLNPKP
jgi:ankyrin repeat protein